MTRSVTGLALGPPGVYRAAVPAGPGLEALRMDVAGFVGVAPRGPVDSPVLVDSWTDYQWQFGDDARAPGPGLLGASVRAFFAQGGRRAWIVRVSPLPRAPSPQAAAATAALALSWGSTEEQVVLRARSEGSWGRRLVTRVDFVARDRFRSDPDGRWLPLPPGIRTARGALLRLAALHRSGGAELRWVDDIEERQEASGARTRVAVLDRAVAVGPTVWAEIVTASVTVTDTTGDIPRQERFAGLGLRSDHDRFAGTVLSRESRLVVADGSWPEQLAPAGADLPGLLSHLVEGTGSDRWGSIGADSFADAALEPERLPLDGPDGLEGLQVHGLDLLSLQPEVMLMSAPDLLWQGMREVPPLHLDAAQDMRTGACSPAHVRLTARQPAAGVAYLDARFQLEEVLARQARFVALAERQRRFVALLDAPPGLSAANAARWRAAFNSSYAAAYHPWLGVVDGASRGQQVLHIPPSACAAGIIAARERAAGISWGPANIIAADVVTTAESLGAQEAEEIDTLDINLFRPERDGFRLVAARTLSTDPDYHQLSVRRLMTMLRLVLERQTVWLAFEPHTVQLRRQVTGVVTRLLRDLFRVGAFAGDTEEQSFFVRCDETVNPSWSVDQGRLVAEVGVAPSVPLEFIVLRLSRGAGGAFTVEV